MPEQEYIYVLSIKRSIYKSLEIIGAFTNIANAKKEVLKNFETYNKDNPTKKIKYRPKNWERSKKDGRFYFYSLTDDLQSFYQITKLKINPGCIVEYGKGKERRNKAVKNIN
jgi:hypothetical protein